MKPLPVAVIAVALFALTSLAGCGAGAPAYYTTGAEVQMANLKATAQGYKEQVINCGQKISNNRDYAPLKLKTSIDATPFALQMFNDTSLPNKNQVALLYRVYADLQECRKFYRQSIWETLPHLTAPLIEHYSAVDKLWVQATAGRLTWGQFNQGQKDLADQWQAVLDQGIENTNAQLQQQHQAEIAQHQAQLAEQERLRAQAIANMAQGLQKAGEAYANRPPPSPTINCNTLATGGGNSTTTCQ